MALVFSKLSPSSQTNNSVGSPNNALLSDDAYAVMNSSSDWIKCTGYVAPASGSIQQVCIGFEGFKSTGGTTTVTLSYEISGVPTGSSQTVFLSQTEQSYLLDVTADRAWTDSDINNITVRIDGDNLSTTKNLNLDHVFVDLVEDDGTGPLTDKGFREFAVNGTPLQVVDTAIAFDEWEVHIQNPDENTGYIYICDHAGVHASNGWKLMPNDSVKFRFSGAQDFYILSQVPQIVIVALFEI